MPLSFAICFCARSLLSQKVGAPISASKASISRVFWSTSKKPPQMAGSFLDVLDMVESLGRDHGNGYGRKLMQPAQGKTAANSVGPKRKLYVKKREYQLID